MRIRLMLVLLALVAFHPLPGAAQVPGGYAPNGVPMFGDTLDGWCAQVKLPSSIAVCSDRELRALAVERQRTYDEARARLDPDQQKALLTDQNGWVASYPGACGVARDVPPALPLAPAIKNCMAQAGRARIAYLRAYGSSPPPQSPPSTTGRVTTPKSTSEQGQSQGAGNGNALEAVIAGDEELWSLAVERRKALDAAKSSLNAEQQKALLTDENKWFGSYGEACGIAPAAAVTTPLAPEIRDCLMRAGRARIAYLRAYREASDVGGKAAGALTKGEPSNAASSVRAVPAAPPNNQPAPAGSVQPEAQGGPPIKEAPPASLKSEETHPSQTPMGVPIDKVNALIDFKSDTLRLIDQIVKMTRSNGYRCDSVTSFRPMILSPGFVISCNNASYTYDIQDKGRGWFVTAE